ncbi:MAG: LptF/LptG family permease, partial [Polaribacter sp.]
LGSIIRKGGFGLPMIMAIAIYVIYYFGNTLGKNMAEESSISSFLGSWFSTMVMLLIGILLTNRATKDKGIFNVDIILQPIINFFKKFQSNKTPKI